MLFKRDDSTSERQRASWAFSSSERNGPISLRPSPLSCLIKPINHGYQAFIFNYQFLFSFVFVRRLSSTEALLSQLPNPHKITPAGEGLKQYRKTFVIRHRRKRWYSKSFYDYGSRFGRKSRDSETKFLEMDWYFPNMV